MPAGPTGLHRVRRVVRRPDLVLRRISVLTNTACIIIITTTTTTIITIITTIITMITTIIVISSGIISIILEIPDRPDLILRRSFVVACVDLSCMVCLCYVTCCLVYDYL